MRNSVEDLIVCRAVELSRSGFDWVDLTTAAQPKIEEVIQHFHHGFLRHKYLNEVINQICQQTCPVFVMRQGIIWRCDFYATTSTCMMEGAESCDSSNDPFFLEMKIMNDLLTKAGLSEEGVTAFCASNWRRPDVNYSIPRTTSGPSVR